MISKELLKEVLLEQKKRIEEARSKDFVIREKLDEIKKFVGIKNNINEYGDEVAWGVLAVISAAYAYGGLKNIGRKIGDTAGGVTKDLVEMIKKFRNRSSQEESH